MDADTSLRCPSAQPDSPGAQVLGVVRRTADGPRVSYVAGLAPVSADVLQAVEPAPVSAVLRIAAVCEQGGCRHFDGRACTLATRIGALLPDVADTLPPCAIRRSCRWFAEQGRGICLKCPQVVTQPDAEAADRRLTVGPLEVSGL